MLAKPKHTWSRRRFIVDRDFQVRLLLRSAIFALFMFGLLCAGILVPLFLDLEAENPRIPDAPGLVLYLHEHLWPVMLFSSVSRMDA